MEAPGRIHPGKNSPFHPGGNIRAMLARQHQTVINLAKRVVMSFAQFVCPQPITPQSPWATVPGPGNARKELLLILRMYLLAIGDGGGNPLSSCQSRHGIAGGIIKRIRT